MALIFTRRGDDALRSRLARAAESALTYADVGATIEGVTPRGYHALRRGRALGDGLDVFAKARQGLRQWSAHRGAGLSLVPEDATTRVGENVIALLSLGRVALAIPCRVIAVVDEPRRFAFAYGTLSGHPESGEELFDVTMDENGVVTFTIRAFSKGANVLTRIGSPVARAIQSMVTTRYLDALEEFVRDG